MSPLVIEGAQVSSVDGPGGQLMITTEVENYPGFVDGIMGPDLMRKMRAQAARFGAEYISHRATQVDLSTRPFLVHVVDCGVYETRALIVATGARAKVLGLDSEERLLGYGVSTCATCDGFFFRDRDVAVVGGGDSALEEAVFLARFVRSVTIVHRRKEFRASKIMQTRAIDNPKVSVLWDSIVAEVLGDDCVTGLRICSTTGGNEIVLEVAAVFIAIGHLPSSDLFRGQLKMSEAGYIVTRSGTRTNVDGVFACGDVQDDVFRQAVTAAGSGCMAAIEAERWLRDQR